MSHMITRLINGEPGSSEWIERALGSRDTWVQGAAEPSKGGAATETAAATKTAAAAEASAAAGARAGAHASLEAADAASGPSTGPAAAGASVSGSMPSVTCQGAQRTSAKVAPTRCVALATPTAPLPVASRKRARGTAPLPAPCASCERAWLRGTAGGAGAAVGRARREGAPGLLGRQHARVRSHVRYPAAWHEAG